MAGIDLTPTALDVAQLEEAISKSAGAAPVSADLKQDFCKVWPTAKQALELLSPILVAIPGVSIFAKAAITAVITAGDTAHKVMCSS